MLHSENKISCTLYHWCCIVCQPFRFLKQKIVHENRKFVWYNYLIIYLPSMWHLFDFIHYEKFLVRSTVRVKKLSAAINCKNVDKFKMR